MAHIGRLVDQPRLRRYARPRIRLPAAETPNLKILVFGAGVLGTLYAVKLSQAGHHTSLQARGGRLADLKRGGARIENLRRRARDG